MINIALEIHNARKYKHIDMIAPFSRQLRWITLYMSMKTSINVPMLPLILRLQAIKFMYYLIEASNKDE